MPDLSPEYTLSVKQLRELLNDSYREGFVRGFWAKDMEPELNPFYPPARFVDEEK